MNSKAVHGSSVDQLKSELDQFKSGKQKDVTRLKEIAKSFGKNKEWDFAFDSFQLVPDQKERNILIADLIEESLLPAKEFNQAKKFAKFIVNHEMQPLVMVRIAIAENNKDQALQIAKNLDSPFTRNFAFIHIIEAFLLDNQKAQAKEACKLILENVKSIYDAKVRSYILRDIAIDLYFANHEKDLAKEAANLIPDVAIKTSVLNKIG